MRRELFMIAIWSVAGVAAAADVYKWTDAGGVVHYSDAQPPDATNAQTVHLVGPVTTQAASAATAPPETGDAAASAPANPVVTGAALPQLRCDQARKNLEVLQSAGAVGHDDGTGKPQALSNAARDAEIAEAQAVIARNCK
jgi:hypothetical protein